jgi:hypothetical protein
VDGRRKVAWSTTHPITVGTDVVDVLGVTIRAAVAFAVAVFIKPHGGTGCGTARSQRHTTPRSCTRRCAAFG